MTVSGRAKIVTLEELTRLSAQDRIDGKRVVLCHGVFDLLHPGHIRHFEEARAQGDRLVVTVTADAFVNKGPGRPAFPEALRAETLATLMYVDYVAVSRFPTAVNAIEAVRPHVYVKGQDYAEASDDITGGILTEEAAVAAYGGRVHFTHGITFSSSSLLNQRGGVYSEQASDYLEKNRGRLTALDIPGQINALKRLKVLVLGDAIVDEYHYCQPLGKSPKETIVSTRYLSQESFAGGILACANHIADFADSVSLVTCLGSQAPQQERIDSLLHPKIARKYFFRDDAPTTVKRRYVEPAFLTKMFQIAYLNDTNLPAKVEGDLYRYLKETLPQYDVVVVADYGHGLLTPALRDVLSKNSRFLALNVQTNSANLGFNPVTKYERADYISIDEPELRLALQQKYAPIGDLLEEFALRYPESAFTITRGHNGSMTRLVGPEQQPTEVPSFSNKIVDRVGAGDAYFALTSLLAARRAAPEVLGFTGNAAGALAVEIVGNRSSLQAAPFLKFIKALLA